MYKYKLVRFLVYTTIALFINTAFRHFGETFSLGWWGGITFMFICDIADIFLKKEE